MSCIQLEKEYLKKHRKLTESWGGGGGATGLGISGLRMDGVIVWRLTPKWHEEPSLL